MKELFIYIDGAARGNPGPAGIGVLIKDKEGISIAEIKEYIGPATNNVAEYRALLKALEEAKQLGARSIKIFADSQLLVNQYLGIYQTKNKNLAGFLNKIREEAKKFSQVEIKYIPREENKQADKLANIAINSSCSPSRRNYDYGD